MVSEEEEEDSTVRKVHVVAVEDSTEVRSPVRVRARDVLLFELSLWVERWQEYCYTLYSSQPVGTLSHVSQ